MIQKRLFLRRGANAIQQITLNQLTNAIENFAAFVGLKFRQFSDNFSFIHDAKLPFASFSGKVGALAPKQDRANLDPARVIRVRAQD